MNEPICAEDEARRTQALASIQDAIREVFGDEYFEKTAQRVLEALPDPDETDRLTHALHRAQAHPDFEYTTTTATARVYPYKRPDGDGWEANEAINGGQTRDEHNETWYWRRSIEWKRRAEAVEREHGEAWAHDFRWIGGLLRPWMDEANELVNRERSAGHGWPVGLGANVLWHKIISNALGGPELPARLGPLFVLQLNAAFGVAAEELKLHPEKRHDPLYEVLHELAGQLRSADSEIRSK